MSILGEAIIISLVCTGIKICYAEGKIFGVVGKWIEELYERGGVYSYIAMPLGSCAYCMASIYGITIHVCLFTQGMGVDLFLLPLTLIASIFLNGLFYNTIKQLDKGL